MGDRPDCEIVDKSGQRTSVEITEVLSKGRRRTAEYQLPPTRGAQPDVICDPHDAMEQVRAIVEKKAARYESGDGRDLWDLLIYFNAGLYPVADFAAVFEKRLHDATLPAARHFRRTWVLWEGRLYLEWQDGMPSQRIWAFRSNDTYEGVEIK